MYECFALHVCVCTTCICSAPKVSQIPQNLSIDGCELLCESWDLTLGPLQEQRVFLAAEMSLQPFTYSFSCKLAFPKPLEESMVQGTVPFLTSQSSLFHFPVMLKNKGSFLRFLVFILLPSLFQNFPVLIDSILFSVSLFLLFMFQKELWQLG